MKRMNNLPMRNDITLRYTVYAKFPKLKMEI